jgi:dihydropteroate synthase
LMCNLRPRPGREISATEDIMKIIAASLWESLKTALAAGVPRENIILDPGLGFLRNGEDNLEVLRRLGELVPLGQPLLIGPSRKSFIGKVLDLPVEERGEGTAAAVAVGIAHGADIVRVHDVRAMARVARLSDAIMRRRQA